MFLLWVRIVYIGRYHISKTQFKRLLATKIMILLYISLSKPPAENVRNAHGGVGVGYFPLITSSVYSVYIEAHFQILSVSSTDVLIFPLHCNRIHLFQYKRSTKTRFTQWGAIYIVTARGSVQGRYRFTRICDLYVAIVLHNNLL